MKSLNKRRRAFCNFYVQCGNATRSAILAGYSSNEQSAASIGCRLLKLPAVQSYINHLEQQLYHEIGITPERMAEQLQALYDDSLRQHRNNEALKVLRLSQRLLDKYQNQ